MMNSEINSIIKHKHHITSILSSSPCMCTCLSHCVCECLLFMRSAMKSKLPQLRILVNYILKLRSLYKLKSLKYSKF